MAESPESKQNPIVRTVSRLLRIMGVTFPKDVPIPKPVVGKNNVNDFTYRELRHVAGFDKNYNSSSVDGGTINEYIKQVSQQSRSWAREAKNLKVMAPEINTAKDTVVSTILSPTDLQTDRIGVVVANTGLGEEIEAELSKVLQDFFNDEYKIGEKASKWIGDALYEQGATSILILPEKNMDIVNDAIDLDYLKSGVDPNDRIASPKDSKSLSGVEYSSEQLLPSFESLVSYKDNEIIDLASIIADEYTDSAISNKSLISTEAISVIKNSANTVAKQLVTLVNDNKNHIMFSSDPTLLQNTATRLNNRIENLTNKVNNNFLFSAFSPTFLVDVGRSHGKDELPIVMKIPYQAVVPVTVPNSPETHIGYFIVVDEWGTPLNEDYYDTTASGGGRKMAEAGTQAVLGKPVSSALSNLVSETNTFDAASSIFGIMLRHMMDAKLNDFGLAGATVGYKESISACLFRQLIHKKRVGIVFVPEPLMMYMCYDYNENGTGKSCIQDSNIIIALRNTLFISGVMAATENSIDKKRIEVSIDEKNTNIEQTLNMVRNAFVEKNMMRFDNNPHTIQRDLVQKSMTIYPKGIRGLQDALNVTTDHASTNSIEPNDTLITKLTDMLIMCLIAPASTMNKTGEDEYSRSVATTNMFFNNKIRGLQSTTTEDLNKFIRLYIYYSGLLRNKIRAILEASDAKRKVKRAVEYADTEAPSMEDFGSDVLNEEPETDSEIDVDEEEREHTIIKPQIKQDIKTNTNTIEANIMKVIMNTSIKLPAPRIVVDKAHFEEIQGYIGTLDTILQAVYADEMTMDIDKYGKPLKLLRSIIKEEMIREYVKSIGFQSSYSLPPLTDISSSNIEENILHLINVMKGVTDIDKHIGNKVLPEDDSAYGGGSSMGGDFGGGFGGDAAGGDEFGADQSMDFGGEPPTNEGGEDQLNIGPEPNVETEKEEPPQQQPDNKNLPGGSIV